MEIFQEKSVTVQVNQFINALKKAFQGS